MATKANELKRVDIILENIELKEAIRKKIKEYEHSLAYIEIVAREQNIIGLNKERLSRYFSYTKPVSGTIKQEHVLWLANFYGINVDVIISVK